MFSTIFKKNKTVASPSPTPPSPIAAEKLMASQEATRIATKVEWESKLQAAMGDDQALLDVAIQAPLIEIKQAAVLAIAGEGALKQAEREFRTHDRRVHRTAKQRYEALIAGQKTAARAKEIIQTATALVDQPIIPVNRLIELDQAWQGLDPALLVQGEAEDFVAVHAKLTGLVRERSDHHRTAQRWAADAAAALAQLNAACAEVLQQTSEYAEMIAALTAASQIGRASCRERVWRYV